MQSPSLLPTRLRLKGMDRQKIEMHALHHFQKLIDHAEVVLTQQRTPSKPPICDNTSQASDWIPRLF